MLDRRLSNIDEHAVETVASDDVGTDADEALDLEALGAVMGGR